MSKPEYILYHIDFASLARLRLGPRESFRNLDKAQVHAVGARAMNDCCQSVLENVQGYDSSYLDEHCTLEVTKTTLLEPIRKIRKHFEMLSRRPPSSLPTSAWSTEAAPSAVWISLWKAAGIPPDMGPQTPLGT